MNLEIIFSIANSLAFFSWILLFVLFQNGWTYLLLFKRVFAEIGIVYSPN